MFGHIDINFDDMFELRMSTNTRGHKYKLFKKFNTSSLRSSSIHWKSCECVESSTIGRC